MCWPIGHDIYEKILYDGISFANMATVNADMKERTVVVNGVSKSHAMTGWRIGYAAGPVEIIAAATKLQSQNTSNPTSIAQKAAVEAQRRSGDCGKDGDGIRKRRNMIVEKLNAIPGITCITPRGFLRFS